MARTSFLTAASLLSSFQTLTSAQTTSNSADGLGPTAQPSSSVTVGIVDISGTPTTYRSVFTIPASADEGANVLPNIEDPQAADPQDVCPGYKASHVQEDEYGLSAILTLAGEPCNVYGTDVEVLNLKVEYQAANRLVINISPANVVSIRCSDTVGIHAHPSRTHRTRLGTSCLKSSFPARSQIRPTETLILNSTVSH